MHAVARILLHGRIENIQVSWVKMGMDTCTLLLQGGANDFGGTLMEETISRMAGAEWGIRKEPEEFVAGHSRHRPRSRRADHDLWAR